jgi:hypothetical protein
MARSTLRVLAREGLAVDYFDAGHFLIKWRKITSEGLQHTDSKHAPLEPGPVEVPHTPYYRQQIRDGALIVVRDDVADQE